MTSNTGPAERPRILHLSRTFEAPPERVWQAWTDGPELARWFWPADRGATAQARAEVGGSWRVEAPQQQPGVGGEYLEVAAPKRLVLSWRRDDEEVASLVRVDLLGGEHGSGLVLEHEGLAPAQLGEHEQEWSDALDRLAEHVAAA